MKDDTKSLIIGWLFSLVPYALVSWGYMALADGGARDFWTALGILFLARLFFSLIETLGGILAWRAYGRKRTIEKYVELLRANNFPKRRYEDEDLSDYLLRIQEDPEHSAANKTAAKDMHFALQAFERFGILLGARNWSAAEVAFDLYSPPSQAEARTRQDGTLDVFDEMFRRPGESE